MLRNKLRGGRPWAKGFEKRGAEIDWAVLSHSLWVLGSLEAAAGMGARLRGRPRAAA